MARKKAEYEIREDGTIINSITGKVLKKVIQNRGYEVVWIHRKKKLVHRLVGEKYVPNPENKPQINHIDGNKLNNHYTNLEWSTSSENIKHGYDNGLYEKRRKEMRAFSDDEIHLIRKSDSSLRELGKYYGVAHSVIWSIKNYKTYKNV